MSAARSAKPSIAEESKGGRSTRDSTSAAVTRPAASSKGHLFGGQADYAFEDPTLSLFERQKLGHYVHKLLA